jgi:flavin reductase (DIM6/NTAB) family NADH-FMN oxidoreductase RutF
LSRQKFRAYFQPSRVVLGVVPDGEERVNVITLCFSMYCSYRPPMLALAVHDVNHSYALFSRSEHFVLSVPGEGLAEQALGCGLTSGRDVDKVAAYGLRLADSGCVGVPGLADAVANVELAVAARVRTGDHLTVIGRALRFAVNDHIDERNLVSVGPRHEGYDLVARKGIHRIAVATR